MWAWSLGQLPTELPLAQSAPLQWERYNYIAVLHNTALQEHKIYDPGDLHQQTSETETMYLVVIWKNTMTSFLNRNTASAAIHIHATSVK